MKKLLILTLVLILALSMAACGNGGAENTTPEDTTTAPADPILTPAPTTTAAPDQGNSDLVTYTVKIEDEAGNPILGGVAQICSETCVPDMTNEGGVFSWNVAKDDYKISFVKVPDGFVAEDAYYFESGATEMTIVLKAA